MLINEVCRKCSLTKKAVEYYIEQGLISPQIQENGYRCFTDEDAEHLMKISILRNLGLSVADIRNILSNQEENMLKEIAGKKRFEVTSLQEKQRLIQELADSHDWEKVHDELQQLEKKQSVLERLINIFPGYYGRYACSHFALYLNEPIVTDEQQEAFETIIDFLDNADFTIPDDLQRYFDEALGETAARFEDGIDGLAVKMSAGMQDAVQDPDRFLSDNREIIEAYLAYKLLHVRQYARGKIISFQSYRCRYTEIVPFAVFRKNMDTVISFKSVIFPIYIPIITDLHNGGFKIIFRLTASVLPIQNDNTVLTGTDKPFAVFPCGNSQSEKMISRKLSGPERLCAVRIERMNQRHMLTAECPVPLFRIQIVVSVLQDIENTVRLIQRCR